MFSSLAKGKTLIKNFSSGADCWSTLHAFQDLGIEIKTISDKVIEVVSSGILKKSFKPLDMGNSGTTTRLITGILAGQDFDSVLIGDESLSKRPMKRVIEPLSSMGAEIESVDGYVPLKIKGKSSF